MEYARMICCLMAENVRQRKKEIEHHIESFGSRFFGVPNFYNNKLMRLNCDFRLNRMEWNGMESDRTKLNRYWKIGDSLELK